jgi:thioredoxin-like negative regulator of GroEL
MTEPHQDHVIHNILSGGTVAEKQVSLPLLQATRLIATGLPVSAELRQQVLNDAFDLWDRLLSSPMSLATHSIFLQATDKAFVEELGAILLTHSWDRYDEEFIPGIADMFILSGRQQDAVPLFREMASAEPEDIGDVERCVATAYALGRMGDIETAIPILQNFALDTRNEDHERCAAIKALGQLKKCNPEVRQSLTTLANDTALDASIRLEASGALIILGDQGRAIAILNSIAHDTSISTFRRIEAMGILAKTGAPEASIALLALLANDELLSFDYRRSAADMLAELGEIQSAIPIFIEIAKDFSPCPCGSENCNGEHGKAIESLLKAGERELALSFIHARLQDKTLPIYSRLNLAELLVDAGDFEEAIPSLLSLMHEESQWTYIKRWAIKKLGLCCQHSEMVTQVLLTHARDKNLDAFERTYSIEALGRNANESIALDTLIELAQSETEPGAIRRAALEAIWNFVDGDTKLNISYESSQ